MGKKGANKEVVEIELKGDAKKKEQSAMLGAAKSQAGSQKAEAADAKKFLEQYGKLSKFDEKKTTMLQDYIKNGRKFSFVNSYTKVTSVSEESSAKDLNGFGTECPDD